MGVKVGSLLLMGVVLSLVASFANAGEGLAVFYRRNNRGVYYPSACYEGDQGIYITGLSNSLWGGKAASCGKYYRVTCIGGANLAPHPCKPGKSVVVKVVDYCASPCNGDFNLSFDAFNQIADPKAGKVRIRYDPL